MKGSQILKDAAEVIRTYGWSQGSHARTTENQPCRITAPEAAYFSIYGAMTRVMAINGVIDPRGDDMAVQGYSPMWEVLTVEARKARRVYNAVHPLFDFNDDRGRTQAGVIEFLLDCAEKLETAETGGNTPETPSKEPK